MKQNLSKESQLLDKHKMSNCEDAYNIILHEKGLPDAPFLHHHDYYEISFYLGKENGIYVIDQKECKVRQGDVILTGLFQSHMFKCARNEKHERFNIGLDPRILLSYSTQHANLLEIFDNINNQPIIRLDVWRFQKYMELIEKLLKLDMKYCRELGERSLIYQILAYLYEDSYKGRLSQPVNSKRIELLTMLVKYIETHLEEDISLDDLATMSNYSVTHISRIFKEETNSTLNHYILEKRLQKAKYLLSGTLPITEVAQQTGFNSYSHFYRVFKKSNGIGPEKWRQSNWQNRDV